MALSERANGFNRQTKNHIRYFWGSIYDQCYPSPIMGVSHFWSSGISGHLLITRWAGSKSQQNEPPFCKLWTDFRITWTGRHLFLFLFQMEETFFVQFWSSSWLLAPKTVTLVVDTVSADSFTGALFFLLLILTLTTCCQNSHSVSTHRQQATVGSYREFLMRGRRLSRALPTSLVLENQLYVAPPPSSSTAAAM